MEEAERKAKPSYFLWRKTGVVPEKKKFGTW